MQTKRLGDIEISTIAEYTGSYRDPLDMFPDATAELVDHHRGWLEPGCIDPDNGMLILAFQSYLVRTGRHTILVDGCVGEDKNRPERPSWHRQKWPWMANLRAAGIAPEEIDIVMCTHLHVDHVGWNTRLEDGKWVPTFPNASYLFGETEYRYWESCYKELSWLRDAFEDSVLPVMEAGKVTLVASDHEIEAGLTLEPIPGHTLGQVALNAEGGGARAIMCGDLFHHALQVPEPHLNSIFCVDGELSARTRTEFVDRHVDTDTLILPAHFPGETAGHIRDVGGERRFIFDE
jgi:glyoxylase-like metal-dependent hydrolase (beta-lactamase superfamily II)